MKKFIIQLSVILFILSVTAIVPENELKAGNAAGGKTIVDYYLQLPDEYFQCETYNILSRKDKLSQIKKKDLKNGYVLASISDGGIPVEVALFNDDYMGIRVLAVNVRCSSGCMCRKLDFFFVSDGKLMKSEGEGLFPKSEDIEKAAGTKEGYEFILSEEGKNIKVAAEANGKILLTIEWSGGTFNIK
ncbi:MAG TPA: hypothetical protein PKG60_14155 [Spirochaetota bacterium]|nr:hypothetical protein [Spirochaetota bacterium]HPS85879.1 hypothetical protein [Spirochaetota bacterium]